MLVRRSHASYFSNGRQILQHESVMARYWVIAPYDSTETRVFQRVWKYDLENRVIAIGWKDLGDVSQMTEPELRETIRKVYPEGDEESIFGCVWRVYHEISQGDTVIARRGRMKMLGEGVVSKTGFHDMQMAKERVGNLTQKVYPNFIGIEEWKGKEIEFDKVVFSYWPIYEIPEERYRSLIEGKSERETKPPSEDAPRVLTLSNAEDQLFDEIPSDEEEEAEIATRERKINFRKPERKVKDLYNDFKEGDLDPRPRFQRGYVWDIKKASRLVESILLHVPIPVVYTAEQDDGREIVIDGQQRLMSLFGFIDGKFPRDGRDFALSGMQVMAELNGRKFKELDKPIQRDLNNYTIPLITITKDSDKELRFEIFERLNTGSVMLNDQELRNCIYRGAYNDLIRELAQNDDFQSILDQPKLRERMLDVEFVLRFLAFVHKTHLNYRAPMKQFLNREMREQQDLNEDEQARLTKAFKKSVELTRTVFGKTAFRRFVAGSGRSPDGYWERKFNKGLYDVIMYGFTQFEKSQVIPLSDSIREEMLWLMTGNDRFIDAISGSGTDRREKVMVKFDAWLGALHDIIGYSGPEPRTFSAALKEQLWKNNPTCAYEKCGQKIMDLTDAEVDHVEFYWRGGRTIPENARLVHRYCNRARGGGRH